MAEDVERGEWTPESVYEWICRHWDTSRPSLTSLKRDSVYVRGGRVMVDSPVMISTYGEDLPFEVASTFNNFVSVRGTKSLRGLPDSVHSLCVSGVGSLEGAPKSVGTAGDQRFFPTLGLVVESLVGVHEHFKAVHGAVVIGPSVKRGSLGILKIPGVTVVEAVQRITVFHRGPTDHYPEALPAVTRVADVFNRYLGKGNAGIVKAQRELIELGLDEYAEL